MVGMLQILTYLLCVYLVFKGVEIFQIAWMSNRQSRAGGMMLGLLMIGLSVFLAFVFVGWADSQVSAIGNRREL